MNNGQLFKTAKGALSPAQDLQGQERIENRHSERWIKDYLQRCMKSLGIAQGVVKEPGISNDGSWYHPLRLRRPQERERNQNKERVWYGVGCPTGAVSYGERC